MKLEDSNFLKLAHEEVILPFGKFYFFEKFIVSEIYEGVHFDWKRVKIISDLILTHYSKQKKMVYLSNRVNSYSIEPQSWLKFDKKYSLVSATGIIAYDKKGSISVVLERLFSKEKINKFKSLKDAIDWALNY